MQVNIKKLFKQTKLVVNCFTEFQTGKSKVNPKLIRCMWSVKEPKSIDSQAGREKQGERERVKV